MNNGEARAGDGRPDAPSIIDRDGVGELFACLKADGYRVIGPRIEDRAIVLAPIDGIADLPAGRTDEQDGGRYRLIESGGAALFDYGPGPQGWKRYLYPPRERLWRAHRHGAGFSIEAAEHGDEDEEPPLALFAARACDLRAIDILDRVLGEDGAADPGYLRRRERAFIVAVDCSRPGGTCFCVSMGGGPKAERGFDVVLTELAGDERHAFLIAAGSAAGEAVLERLSCRPASDAERAAGDALTQRAAAAMGREMVADVAPLLRRNLEHRRWQEVAERCLTCGNCTMVCPTCFCADVEDSTELSGNIAERWRQWGSCFTLEISYIHGGSIRRSAAARYRQWMTHKLSSWHEQFASSGCVGCGRCITWCPVGIDITEEARAIRDSEEGR